MGLEVSSTMKILAFNGSPRKQNGMTDKLLDIFLESARKAGAEVTKHYVTDLDIKGCLGCFGCWWSTPGKCVQRDDMDWVLEQILDTDIIVWSSPIYHDNIIHHLQRLRERTLPTALPEFILNKGETTHPGRYKKQRKNVVIATAGFPEPSAFDVVKRLFQNAVHIHLPASSILYAAEEVPMIQDFIVDVESAATKLVKGEEIEGDLKDRLSLVYPPEVKHEIIHRHNEMSKNQTPSG
jgi:multimeric flavodoxin WrbA